MSFKLYYKPWPNVVPIINNVAYDTTQLTSPVKLGEFSSVDSAKYWVTRHLRYGTLVKSAESLAQDTFLSGWGTNSGPQPQPLLNSTPFMLTGVKNIALGPFHGIAVLYSNIVTGWGSNSDGQINPSIFNQLKGERIKKIVAGNSHTLFLSIDGKITGVGGNNATAGNNLENIKDISAGSYHSLVLFENGNITGWGGTSAGDARFVPDFLQTGGLGLEISAGTSHNLAILRNNITPFELFPDLQVQTTILTGWGEYQNLNNWASNLLTGEFKKDTFDWAGLKKISAGTWHSLAIIEKWIQRSPGSDFYDKVSVVTGWGRNDPPIDGNQGPDVNLANGGDNLMFVDKIFAGPYHNIAQFYNGQITGWGQENAFYNTNMNEYKTSSIRVNYNFNLVIKEKTSPTSWETSEVLNNWPYNDLYVYETEPGEGGIDAVPC